MYGVFMIEIKEVPQNKLQKTIQILIQLFQQQIRMELM